MNGHLLAPLLQQGVVDSSLGGSLAEPSDTNTDRSMQTRATVVSLMVTILGTNHTFSYSLLDYAEKRDLSEKTRNILIM